MQQNHGSKHSDPIAPNLLEREPRLVTDVTCVWTAQGWLFLAASLDLFSRRVVGWARSECRAHRSRSRSSGHTGKFWRRSRV